MDDGSAVGNGDELDKNLNRIQRLSMINANARYELINANQQLIDFQMNRYIKHANEQKRQSHNRNLADRNKDDPSNKPDNAEVQQDISDRVNMNPIVKPQKPPVQPRSPSMNNLLAHSNTNTVPKNPENVNQTSTAASIPYDILNFTTTPSNGRGINRMAKINDKHHSSVN